MRHRANQHLVFLSSEIDTLIRSSYLTLHFIPRLRVQPFNKIVPNEVQALTNLSMRQGEQTAIGTATPSQGIDIGDAALETLRHFLDCQ
jgi:hypothetical protein